MAGATPGNSSRQRVYCSAMNEHLNLTEPQLRRAAAPASGSRFLRDVNLTGFGARIWPNGTVAFIVERRRRSTGKVERITLGRWHETPGRRDGTELLTVEEARAKAHTILGDLGDPAAEPPPTASTRRRKARYTLSEVFDLYMADRGARLKQRTKDDYQTMLDTVLKPWKDTDITEIDRQRIKDRHRTYAEKSPARANGGMRVLRLLLNWAITELEDQSGRSIIDHNPVARLSKGRGFWHRVPRRQTVIKPHQLPAWLAAVRGLEGERSDSHVDVVRDYLLTLLFTGLRKSEAAGLTAQDIDLADQTLTVRDTKNHEAHTLPIPSPLQDMFKRRLETADPWLFPTAAGDGPLDRVERWQKKVAEASGVPFALHDLRRTFTTVAESLDISVYTIKALLNHKTGTGDVTRGYAVLSLERLRGAMERISEHILQLANEGEKAPEESPATATNCSEGASSNG